MIPVKNKRDQRKAQTVFSWEEGGGDLKVNSIEGLPESYQKTYFLNFYQQSF